MPLHGKLKSEGKQNEPMYRVVCATQAVHVGGGRGAPGGGGEGKGKEKKIGERTHPHNLSQVTVHNPDCAGCSCQEKKRSSCDGVGAPFAHKKFLFWL